jgi:hypothetical protein
LRFMYDNDITTDVLATRRTSHIILGRGAGFEPAFSVD